MFKNIIFCYKYWNKLFLYIILLIENEVSWFVLFWNLVLIIWGLDYVFVKFSFFIFSKIIFYLWFNSFKKLDRNMYI